jgi:DNA-binding beta-propeller fold protein YncE
MKRSVVFALATVAIATVAIAANAWAVDPGLYGVQTADGEGSHVYRIDPATAAATRISSMPFDVSLAGATFLHDQLYVSDVLQFVPTAAFYGMVDVETGAYTGIHDQGFDLNWHGLASSESLGVTWSISQQADRNLVETALDGSFHMIGPTGIDGRGMAYDDANGILYAINFSDASLYTVDIATGLSTRVGPTGTPCDAIGLAYDEFTRTLYMSEGDVTDSLYTLDVSTGAATLVGELGFHFIDGLAWVPEPASFGLLALGAVVALRRR